MSCVTGQPVLFSGFRIKETKEQQCPCSKNKITDQQCTKTKMHISCEVNAQLIRIFVFEYVKTGLLIKWHKMHILYLYLIRIFAVHVDYGLTLTLGLALLLKYVFVDRHHDMLEVKHAIDLQRAMSAVDVVTQTDAFEEKGTMIQTNTNTNNFIQH